MLHALSRTSHGSLRCPYPSNRILPKRAYGRIADPALTRGNLADILDYSANQRLRKLFDVGGTQTSGRKKGDFHHDSPFRQHCADNAEIWNLLYIDLANAFDKNLAKLFDSDLDPLLIFAGLFSAILSAFLIEIRKDLQEDLVTLIQSQHNATSPKLPQSGTFVPTLSSRWVNGLWFISLMFSLVSALGASVAKGWVTQFSSTVSGSSWDSASVTRKRLRVLKQWHLQLVIGFLPILIHIAFFLFAAGLIVLLFDDDRPIAIAILVLTALVGTIYIANSFLSAYHSDFPFRTPVSHIIRGVFTVNRYPNRLRPIPSRKDDHKAYALSWLLSYSTDSKTVNAAVHALAGLPFTASIQAELTQDSTTPNGLASLLSKELLNSAPNADFVCATMYALLHLVQVAQPAPSEPVDEDPLTSLHALLKPGNALSNIDSMPLSVQTLAVCLKGRIIWFLSAHGVNDSRTLFERDIPVLASTCADPSLRRSLIELALLYNAPKDSQLFFPDLEQAFADTPQKLNLSAFVHRLVNGTIALRPKYADLLAELSAARQLF
ncbi:hypothetical protein B0H13DRAFT_1011365 [Mycena leptocephala]|nr:hypothetical protein B0H13DRAFT_1011365 [Mycena leptocephala]